MPSASRQTWLCVVSGLLVLGCGVEPHAEQDDGLPPRAGTLAAEFTEDPVPFSACPKSVGPQLYGTVWSDTLTAKQPASCIDADAGDDTLSILSGADRSVVLAGNGDDSVTIANDVHLLNVSLGDGKDVLVSEGGSLAVWAGRGPDEVVAASGADYLFGGPDDDRLDGGKGDDTIAGERGNDTLLAGPGLDLVTGGVGDDTIEGGPGDDLLFGDEGSDRLIGGLGADLLEGGGDADQLVGDLGEDRLLGHAGDDRLEGGDGNDLLLPGAGIDIAEAGSGDDLVVILHACQVDRGEELRGGDGHDTLLTPMSLAELDAAGVQVSGFEVVREFPDDGFECDPVTCDCGQFEHAPVARRNELCDYSSPEFGLSDTERADAEAACEALLDDVGNIFDGLPPGASEEDIEAALPKAWSEAFAPTRIAQFGGTTQPHQPGFPPTTPMPNVSTDVEPCDMPQLDLHIGVARGGLNNCYGTEKSEVNDALDHSRFMIFRMRQQIDAVANAPTQADAEALWTMGSEDDWGRFALSNWFGDYSSGRVAAVRSTVDELEDIFYKDDDPLIGLRHNVQCYHRLKWWQYILYGRLNPLTIAFKTVANPCFYGSVAHAAFAVPVAGRIHAASAYYPFESIELCEDAFDDDTWDPPEVLGGIIMHELLHFHRNSQGALGDRHGSADDGICDGPCYLAPVAEALADQRPNTAVVNIDNYRLWANTTHTLYTDGYCDDTDPGICLESDCCGDGVLQADLSETCDGSDFGGRTCMTEAELSEGDLQCSADCQTISDTDCHGECGNGMVDPALGEVCDGGDLGTESCASLFGSDMGSLDCTGACTYDTSACDGTFPTSYWACGVEPGSSCLQNPEDCHEEDGAGTCTGGPCARTDPGARLQGMSDPNGPFHPRGNFRDIDGHLYRCDDGPSGPRTCVDEEGFGVCRECGTEDGQTMLGCPCIESEDCGLDMTCFGGQFPQGGFCWPADDGPPSFQCEQGACGQEFWGPDGGSYCEHYPPSGQARCMPQRCEEIPAMACAEQGLICDSTGDACANECDSSADCDVGWPDDTVCANNECQVP